MTIVAGVEARKQFNARESVSHIHYHYSVDRVEFFSEIQIALIRSGCWFKGSLECASAEDCTNNEDLRPSSTIDGPRPFTTLLESGDSPVRGSCPTSWTIELLFRQFAAWFNVSTPLLVQSGVCGSYSRGIIILSLLRNHEPKRALN
jgi:hypothetical protein